MQSVSSRIWTHVAVSISYDDNHYTMATPTVFLWAILHKEGIEKNWSKFRSNLLDFIQTKDLLTKLELYKRKGGFLTLRIKKYVHKWIDCLTWIQTLNTEKQEPLNRIQTQTKNGIWH